MNPLDTPLKPPCMNKWARRVCVYTVHTQSVPAKCLPVSLRVGGGLYIKCQDHRFWGNSLPEGVLLHFWAFLNKNRGHVQHFHLHVDHQDAGGIYHCEINMSLYRDSRAPVFIMRSVSYTYAKPHADSNKTQPVVTQGWRACWCHSTVPLHSVYMYEL